MAPLLCNTVVAGARWNPPSRALVDLGGIDPRMFLMPHHWPSRLDVGARPVVRLRLDGAGRLVAARLVDEATHLPVWRAGLHAAGVVDRVRLVRTDAAALGLARARRRRARARSRAVSPSGRPRAVRRSPAVAPASGSPGLRHVVGSLPFHHARAARAFRLRGVRRRRLLRGATAGVARPAARAPHGRARGGAPRSRRASVGVTVAGVDRAGAVRAPARGRRRRLRGPPLPTGADAASGRAPDVATGLPPQAPGRRIPRADPQARVEPRRPDERRATRSPAAGQRQRGARPARARDSRAPQPHQVPRRLERDFPDARDAPPLLEALASPLCAGDAAGRGRELALLRGRGDLRRRGTRARGRRSETRSRRLSHRARTRRRPARREISSTPGRATRQARRARSAERPASARPKPRSAMRRRGSRTVPARVRPPPRPTRGSARYGSRRSPDRDKLRGACPSGGDRGGGFEKRLGCGGHVRARLRERDRLLHEAPGGGRRCGRVGGIGRRLVFARRRPGAGARRAPLRLEALRDAARVDAGKPRAADRDRERLRSPTRICCKTTRVATRRTTARARASSASARAGSICAVATTRCADSKSRIPAFARRRPRISARRSRAPIATTWISCTGPPPRRPARSPRTRATSS